MITLALMTLVAAPVPYAKLIKQKTLAEAKKALDSGTSPNTKGGDRTWLSFAAEANKLELAALLIEKGAELETTDDAGYTPLWYAVEYASADMVKLLIAKGAKPSPVAKRNGKTPLHKLLWLEKRSKLDMIAALIEGGANVNAKSSHGETPLHSGASVGDVERLGYLLEHGAKLDATDKNGNTPLHTAALYRRLKAVELFVAKGANPNARDNAGRTPLSTLVHPQYEGEDAFETARVLARLGTNVNDQDNEGDTALHAAVVNNNPAWIKTLLTLKIDTTIENKKKKTALRQAVINQKPPAILALAPACKPELDALDGYGATFVHNAVINDESELLKTLIAAGADLNVKNKWGKTPLGLARQSGKDAMAKQLEAAGATE